MFTGLRSQLMISFSALLLVCLCIVTITFTFLFFVWVSLPELAFAHLTDAAVPALTTLRSTREPRSGLIESFQVMKDLARERGVRILLLTMPDSTVIADTEGSWTGKQLRLNVPANGGGRPILRGRVRGLDRRWNFYVAIPLQELPGEQAKRALLVLTMTLWDTARPVISSMLASVLLSGAIAFVLSILFALWLAGTLSRPLQRAAAAAERVAAGDYSTQLEISIPDEARRLAESFNAMTSAVATSQRSQSDFVANVSHELKTPVTSIQGFAQAVLDGTANDERSIHRAATVIHDEADRLSRMINQLLDLTRLESGQVSMSWSNVDLAALIQSCTDRFGLLASEKGVELHALMPDQVQTTGDGDRLMQVLTNLVDNALKHTSAGGKVTLSAREDSDSVAVLVTDTGSGIPKADLPRIFERFYQVDKSRSRDTDARDTGVGLGLAIASEIVRAHGGSIEVDSIVDIGTRFTVTLPRTPVSTERQRGQTGGQT